MFPLSQLEAMAAQAPLRRRELLGAALASLCETLRELPDGGLTMELGPHEGEARLVLWFCRGLLATGEAATANRLIESLEWRPESHFNSHFVGVAGMCLLLQHGDELGAGARTQLEKYVLMYLSDWMTEDFRLHGANDNAGIECATAVALAGRYFNNPDLETWAHARLQRLVRLLEVRSYLHECNSPTYSAVSLATLAELSERAKNVELRKTARQLELQVWRELLTHFHPVIGQQVGPFSRTFSDDNANQCSLWMMALFVALGEVSPFHPRALLFPPPPGTFAHNSWPFQWASLCALACAPLRAPLELTHEMLNRQFPFALRGDCEFSPMGESPGGWSPIGAHVEADFAVSFFGARPGAGTAAHWLYRREEIARDAPIGAHLSNLRSMVPRCTVSSRLANFHLRDAATLDSELNSEDGAAFCVGQGRALLLGYVPTRRLHDTRTIRFALALPTHFSQPDEMRVGRTRVTGSASFPALDWVFVRDGAIFLAIRPLLAQQKNALFCTLQIARFAGATTIGAFSLCDFAPHAFDDAALRSLGGGFVVEIAPASEWADFESFCAAFQNAQIQDFQWGGQRELRYRRGETDLELLYDTRTLTPRRAVSRHLKWI